MPTADRARRRCEAPGGTPHDAATIALHHLAAAVAGAAVRLLGLDLVALTAMPATAAALIDDLTAPADNSATCAPGPSALGRALTDILGEDHGHWTARLVVA